MSISFFVENAPRVTVETPCHCETGVDRADCPYCDGTGVWVERGPAAGWELNVSNMNAAALLRLLAIEPDYGGTISPEAIPGALRAILRALNSEVARAAEVLEPATEEAPRGARVVDGRIERTGGATIHWGGRSDEYLTRRLRDLAEVLRNAQDVASPVHWG